MDVNGLVFSRLNHEALSSAGEVPGLAGNCGLGAMFPRSFAMKPHFGDLVHFTYRILERGRLAVQGLRSPQPGIESLGEAFAGIPTQLGLSAAVGFQVVVEGRPRELKGMPRDEVYSIGREAIVNAYRHSRAKNIAMSVEFRASELRIAVRDNGCGIDPSNCGGDRTDTGASRECNSEPNESARDFVSSAESRSVLKLNCVCPAGLLSSRMWSGLAAESGTGVSTSWTLEEAGESL